VIAVEMTLEEQEVYAVMGVSPLVLTQETVKDPKSTIIAVTLPGQRATLNVSALLAGSKGHSDVASKPDLRIEMAEMPVMSISVAAPIPVGLPSRPEPKRDDGFDTGMNNGAVDGDAASRRRRRRRSSVSTNGGDSEV
jgi:ribonuclease E